MRLSKYIILSFLILLTVGGIMVACSSDECYDNKNALPYAGFYGVIDGKETSIRIDSVEVYGAGVPGDSILSTGRTAISNLYLPFRIDCDTTRYVFRYLQKDLEFFDLRDTVTFIYNRNPRFVSAACGVSYVFELTKIQNTGLLIDSVVCQNMQITNANVENIKIYVPVATEATEEESRVKIKNKGVH